MSQFDPVIGADKSGLAYRQDDNNGKKALLTHHKGASAPSYAEAGTFWIDDSASPWVLKTYDDTDWIGIGTIDATSNLFTPYWNGGALVAASLSAKGLVERATDAEAALAADTERYVTPAQLGIYGGAIKLISAQTASDDSSIEFTDLGSYHSLIYVCDYATVSTDGQAIILRTSSDGGSTWDSGASDYARTNVRYAPGGSVTAAGGTLTHIIVTSGNGIGNAVNEFAAFEGRIMNVASSVFTAVLGQSVQRVDSGNNVWGNTSGYRISAAAINGLQFSVASGTFSGTIKLYGVK